MANTVNPNITFGAVGNGVTDDTAALQSAINFAQANNLRLELEGNSKYRTSAPLIVRQGSAGGKNYSFDMDGFGATLLPTHAGFTIEVQTQTPLSAGPTGADAMPVSMRRFQISGDLSKAATGGIKVGRSGYRMYCFSRLALLEDVTTTELRGRALEIINASHFDINRFVQRTHNGGSGLLVDSIEGFFAGDMSFNDCQFQGTAAGRPLHLRAYGNRSELRGVRFNQCVVYGTGTRIEASTNATTADIWLSNCAWDGPGSPSGEDAIYIYANASARVDRVWLTNPYIVNYTGAGIRMQSDGPAMLRGIKISGGSFTLVNEPIKTVSAEGFVIENCDFFLNRTWALINIDLDCKRFRISDCNEDNNTASHLIAVGGAGTQQFQITDNTGYSVSGGIVNDYSGGVSKNVVNNVRL